MHPLAPAVEAHLSLAIGAPVQVQDLRPLGGGACQEHLLVRVAPDRDLVLRSDAGSSLPGSLPRRVERQVMQAARAAGVRTPEPRWPAEDLVRPGASSYFMDRLHGEAVGARVLRLATPDLPRELARELARIHSVRPSAELPLPDSPPRATLDFLRGMLRRLPEPRPALDLAMRWLEERLPEPGESTLVHGDFRTGNFLVAPEGLQAVLDWEFAHWGCPEEDLAWFCVRDWRFGQVAREAGGLTGREEFLRLYAEESGRTPDPERVRWWEVLGNVRWAAGALLQSLRPGDDLELLAIGPRAVEMEYEALRVAGFVQETPDLPPLRPPDPILERVAGFLLANLPQEDRALAFRTRIAAHLVGLKAREATNPPAPSGDLVRDLAQRVRIVNPHFDLRTDPC